MRTVVLAALLAVVCATAAAHEPRLVHVAAPDFAYAEWLADGSGFYVIGEVLDEDTIVVSVGNGPVGTSQRRLERVEWRTGRRQPLLPTKPTCTDLQPSGPPRGGAIVFQRLCDDPADSFGGLVRVR